MLLIRLFSSDFINDFNSVKTDMKILCLRAKDQLLLENHC